jgi:hypothetical protein
MYEMEGPRLMPHRNDFRLLGRHASQHPHKFRRPVQSSGFPALLTSRGCPRVVSVLCGDSISTASRPASTRGFRSPFQDSFVIHRMHAVIPCANILSTSCPHFHAQTAAELSGMPAAAIRGAGS